jgi:hypothetical protein
MKNLLFTLTISLMTLSAANAAPFTQADDADRVMTESGVLGDLKVGGVSG